MVLRETSRETSLLCLTVRVCHHHHHNPQRPQSLRLVVHHCVYSLLQAKCVHIEFLISSSNEYKKKYTTNTTTYYLSPLFYSINLHTHTRTNKINPKVQNSNSRWSTDRTSYAVHPHPVNLSIPTHDERICLPRHDAFLTFYQILQTVIHMDLIRELDSYGSACLSFYFFVSSFSRQTPLCLVCSVVSSKWWHLSSLI